MRLNQERVPRYTAEHIHKTAHVSKQSKRSASQPAQKRTGLVDTSQNAFASVITTHPPSLTHLLPASKSQLVWSDGSWFCHLSHPSATPP